MTTIVYDIDKINWFQCLMRSDPNPTGSLHINWFLRKQVDVECGVYIFTTRRIGLIVEIERRKHVILSTGQSWVSGCDWWIAHYVPRVHRPLLVHMHRNEFFGVTPAVNMFSISPFTNVTLWVKLLKQAIWPLEIINSVPLARPQKCQLGTRDNYALCWVFIIGLLSRCWCW